MRMPLLADSSPLLTDSARLREQAEGDGYLFLRGLIPTEPVRGVRESILEICRRHGFAETGGDGLAVPGIRFREGEPEYMAAYDEIQRLEGFHALAHRPEVLALLRDLFQDEVLVHPRNIARVMFPDNNTFTTPAHQDYVHIQGTANTWTAWIPLGDCPEELGGVEVLAGSHRSGVLPVRAAYGAGGLGVETDHLGLEWHSGPFRTGDVLLFHSHSVHRGRDNRTPDQLRLSVDYRYQPISEPVTEFSLLPHYNRAPWEAIYEGWTQPELQFYWRQHDLKPADFTRQYHASAGR